MSLRVGIVGIASKYWPGALARNLRALPEADLRAAAHLGASDELIAATCGCAKEEFARQQGVKLYEGIEAMIEAEHLDAVAICSRHSRHADHVEQAASRGVHVYICKTMATTREDAARIVAAGQRHAVRIAVGPTGRLVPHHVLARQVIESGRIGEPIAIRVAHNHGTIDTFAAGDWYRDAAEGGPELSLGWYVIDVVRALAPSPVVRVHAEYGNFASPGSAFMDQGKILMRLGDGTLAACDLYFSNRFAFPTWDLEVVGTHGVLRTHATAKDDGVPPALLWSKTGIERLEVPKGDNWIADTAAWVSAFANNTPPPVDAEEGRIITELSLACLESHRARRAVEPATVS